MRKILLSIMILVLVVGTIGCSNEGPGNQAGNTNGDMDFPTRQIRYIVPYGPGGLSDMSARLVEKVIRTNDMLDVSFTVTNIEGASAGNGMVEVRDAKADGHTLLHHHTSFIAHELTGIRDWGYKDFVPVVSLFDVPGVFVAHPDKYDTFEEWVEDVRNNPGETTFGGSSLGGSTHIFAAQILSHLDIDDKLNYIAYGGGGDLATAMLGGEDNMAAAPLPQMLDYHLNGDLKILAVGTEKRLESLPDVPTLKELGIEVAMPVTQRMGIWAPPETPDTIVDELYKIFKEVVGSEDFIEEASQMGINPVLGDGKFLYELFENDEKVMKQLIEDLGITN